MSTTVSEITRLPTQDELPYDDGEPMETGRHRLQMELLIRTLQPWLDQRGSGYAGGNMFVYFSPNQVLTHDFKGPDVFVALDVEPKERKSWLVWEEQKSPDVIIELLSDSTANYDKTDKKMVYQDRLACPEYYWFDPWNSDDWAGFTLVNGVYQKLLVDIQQRLLSPRLGVALIRWQGIYQNVDTTWLRWASAEGKLLLTPEEAALQQITVEENRANAEAQRADAEAQRANTEAQRAEAEAQIRRKAEQRAEVLAAKLKALGIDPGA